MDIFYKHQIDHRPSIVNVYRSQPSQTSLMGTNERASEALFIAISNDENQLLEPVVLYTHFSKDQGPDRQYVLKTTLGLISFRIMNPNFISLQADPFLIRLKAPCHKKRTYHKHHCVKSFRFTGLQVLQQSNAYFYFRPSPQCRHIFKEGRIRFQSHLLLHLTDAALCTRVYIRKGAPLGTLQPVLKGKYLKEADTIDSQPPLTNTIR